MGRTVIVSKQQLAEAYGVNKTYFFRKLHTNKEIISKLVKAGYNTSSRILTPKQIEIICEYLGYPEVFDQIENQCSATVRV